MKNAMRFLLTTIACSLLAGSAAQAAEPVYDDNVSAVRLELDNYSGDAAALGKAINEVNAIISASPRNAPAYKELARGIIMSSFDGQGSFSKQGLGSAEQVLKKAIALAPEFSGAYVLFGHLYHLMGKDDAAKAALDKAESLRSTDPWLAINRADILRDSGNCPKATENYQAALASKALNPKGADTAYEGLIQCATMAGDYDNAEKYYHTQIDANPNLSWPHGNYAGFLTCYRGNYDLAVEEANKALTIADYGRGRLILAMALYGKWAQAKHGGKDTMVSDAYYKVAHRFIPDITIARAEAAKCPKTTDITAALQTIPAAAR